MTQPTGRLGGHNPDVLSCIANLSSDEVFTPPDLANAMLDVVGRSWADSHGGESIWSNPDVRFLDPFAKTGVFLREITRRLSDGLADSFPDLQQRVDHIVTKQVYGMAITQLTSLLARRSVYCSKDAMSKHSIANAFATSEGNIWFERTEHSWANGKCTFCGVSKAEYDRGSDLETHAYPLIHEKSAASAIRRAFGEDMHFDVIIGNPPYQLGSNGGTRDIPIYHHFVRQAKSLDPSLLCMIIPARWFATGLGLSDFRREMLGDQRISAIVDYPVAREVFREVEVKGGVCYFLWDRAHSGPAAVTSIRANEVSGPFKRDLNEHDVLVRDYRAVEILRKVLAAGERSVTEILSADKEFGWTSNFDDFSRRPLPGYVPLYYNRKGSRQVGYIARQKISKSAELVDTWKVMVPKAGSDGGQRLPDVVLGRPFVAPSPSVCTQTYLFFHTNSEESAESIRSYLATRFLRFLVSLRKITQDAPKSTYLWVPLQTWDRTWSDDALFKKYGISSDEARYIESMVKQMELGE